MSGSVSPAKYRFGDSVRPGVVLGLSLRQSLPVIAGVVWLTLWLVAQQPVVAVAGLVVGLVVSFGRWRHAPLYEVALPGIALTWRRMRQRNLWVRASLLGAGPGFDDQLPVPMRGLELVERRADWASQPASIAVVRDRPAGTVSLAVSVRGAGFPIASLTEQDQLLASWALAMAPLARSHCPVTRLTWQEWAHPVGVDGHREFLASVSGHGSSGPSGAAADYGDLLAMQAPMTIAHEVLLTITVDLRRVRHGRHRSSGEMAMEALVDEARLLAGRLESAGLSVDPPLTPSQLSIAIRLRSDPTRASQLGSLRRSLAASVGQGALEWGPMAVEADWSTVRVDGSHHRSYRVIGWPMLPVPADWLAPLLTGDGATRTVTVVMEPVPLARAAADASRHLTSIESDHAQKERHGFRLTARERRRQADVEDRERELAEGHPEFRHAALVTVTASDAAALEDAAARVEQAAAQSLLDIRPLAARQSEGWVASLPLGRSIRNGTSS